MRRMQLEFMGVCRFFSVGLHSFNMPYLLHTIEENLTFQCFSMRRLIVVCLRLYFPLYVQGCIDSLAVFCKVFPGQPNYKQENLVNSLLHTTYKANDAMEDVISLSLCTKTMLSIVYWHFPLHLMLFTTTCYLIRQSI